MEYPYVNIHTHRRMGEGVEVVSVMAGRGLREAARAAVAAGEANAADMAATASIEDDLPEQPFSIGIHPWQLAGGNGLPTETRMSAAGRHGRVEGDNGRGDFIAGEFDEAISEVETASAAAIGEIGLDHAVAVDRDRQEAVFAAQLRIAGARRLPVILHCVRAFEPIMEMLAAHNLPAVIFHGFIGSREQAARAIRAGYYLSLGERSLASPKTVEALRSIPLERLFLETDDSPTPIAGIYSRAAEPLAVSERQLAKQLYINYMTIFEQ